MGRSSEPGPRRSKEAFGRILTEHMPGVYSFPCFTPQFCDQILAEVLGVFRHDCHSRVRSVSLLNTREDSLYPFLSPFFFLLWEAPGTRATLLRPDARGDPGRFL